MGRTRDIEHVIKGVGDNNLIIRQERAMPDELSVYIEIPEHGSDCVSLSRVQVERLQVRLERWLHTGSIETKTPSARGDAGTSPGGPGEES